MSYGMTRRRLLALGGQAALAAAASRAFTPESWASLLGQSTDYAPAYAAIDSFVEQHLREMHAPALTLGLAAREGVLRAAAYGLADVKTGERLTAAHRFQIGSISKSFVGIAAVQMQEEGKLDLHRPVTEYLPWLRIRTQYGPITAHHLLSHTSGLPGNFIAGPAMELWTAHAPGEHFHYNNLGYDLLGRLLETVDQRPFPEIIRRRILAPLGMNDSWPTITNDVRHLMPVSYVPRYDDRPLPRGGPMMEAPVMVMENPAGSVLSTPADMALYMQMLLRRGQGTRGRVLSDKGFALFTRPVIAAPAFGEKGQYAYGIATTTADGHQVLRHTGGMVSFSSAMHVDMDEGVAAFASVSARLEGYRPNAVAAYALRVLYAARHGHTMPELPAPVNVEEVPNAADYAGTYTAPGGRKLEFIAGDRRLFVLRNGEKIAVQRRGPDQFLALDGDLGLFPFQFGREDGAVVELAHGPDWYTGESYSGPRSFDYPKEWDAYTGHYRNDNPWMGSLRVIVRKGRLTLGGVAPLVPIGPGTFRIGEEEHNPGRITFDTMAEGKALRAILSGTEFHRSWAR